MPLEMILPRVLSGMEQGDQSTGIRVNAGNVGAFVEVTACAGQAKVRGIVTAAVLPGNNMFDVKRGKWLILLSQPAVFADILGTLLHECASRRIHYASPSGWLIRARALDWRMEMNLRNRAIVS